MKQSLAGARDYNFPALTDGRVRKEELPDGSPSGGQGWYINTRHPKFADVRVREAIAGFERELEL